MISRDGFVRSTNCLPRCPTNSCESALFIERDGDCGLWSGQPIPSLAILNPGHDEGHKGDSRCYRRQCPTTPRTLARCLSALIGACHAASCPSWKPSVPQAFAQVQPVRHDFPDRRRIFGEYQIARPGHRPTLPLSTPGPYFGPHH